MSFRVETLLESELARSDTLVQMHQLFPFTLALSLRERELLSSSQEHSHSPRAVAASWPFGSESGRTAERARLATARRMVLPLPEGPEGEGWGEGERYILQSNNGVTVQV